MKYLLKILALSILISSCTQSDEDLPYDEKIVVEGFIEEGKGAIVWLTKSLYVPHGQKTLGKETIRDIPIRWAKVTINDGLREEVLIGGRDTDHLLEYYYKGYDIKGEQGRTYTLTIEYSGQTLTAVTTIPGPADIGEISVEKNSDKEGGLYQVNAVIRSSSADGFYMLMAKPADSGIYRPCLFGTVDGVSLNEDNTPVQVYRPMSIGHEEDYYPTYHSDEHIMLRLASIPRDAFDFWSGFMNDVINARNPIYPSASNLKSNIQGGGLGIWYGFSAAYSDIDISQYVD